MIVAVGGEVTPGRCLCLLRDPGEMASINDMDALPLAPAVEFPRKRLRVTDVCWEVRRSLVGLGLHHLEDVALLVDDEEAMFARLRGGDVLLRLQEGAEIPPCYGIEIEYLPVRVNHIVPPRPG